MQEISIRNRRKGSIKTFTGAGCWAELSKEQFMAVINSKLLITDLFEQAIVMAKIVFDIPVEMVKSLTTVQAHSLAGTMQFLYSGSLELEAWHLPKIFRTGKQALIGPSDTLGNITFGELMFADLALRKYKATNDEKFLNQLICVLYRVGDKENYRLTGDEREPFNKNLLEQQVADLGHIAEVKKQAILVNYIGCREVMSKSFAYVFPKKEETNATPSNETWLDVAIQLARKDNALGNIAEVEKTNAWLVLKVLDKVIKESEDLQAEMDKRK